MHPQKLWCQLVFGCLDRILSTLTASFVDSDFRFQSDCYCQIPCLDFQGITVVDKKWHSPYMEPFRTLNLPSNFDVAVSHSLKLKVVGKKHIPPNSGAKW